MAVVKYGKLIRDNIPAVSKKNGRICKTRVMDDEEYLAELNKKLQEETNEYLKTNKIKELVDLQEIVYAILDHHKISKKDFEKQRQERVKTHGAFKEKLFLIEVEDNGNVYVQDKDD